MKKRSTAAAMLLCLVSLTALAQTGPAPPALTRDQKRDMKRIGDGVARQFREARRRAKLPGSGWRFHCTTMQKLACTAARTGTAGGTGHPEFQALYWSSDPAQPSPDMERVAAADTGTEKNGRFRAARFSVVVWPTDQPRGYWIGIDLHPDPIKETWIDLNAFFLTCDGRCPPPPIAPECENLK